MREIQGVKRDIAKLLHELGYKPLDTEMGLRVQIKDLSVECKSFLANHNASIFEDLPKEDKLVYTAMVRAIMLMRRLYSQKYNKDLKI